MSRHSCAEPVFSHNQVVGSLKNKYLLVFDWETEQLCYCECENADTILQHLIGTALERAVLYPVSEIQDPELVLELETIVKDI